MSQKTTVALLIVLAVVVGYILLWKAGWLGPRDEKPDTERLNRTLVEKPPQPGDIIALTLEHPDRPNDKPLSAEYRDGAWHLVAPLQFKAQKDRLDKVITMFSDLRIAAIYSVGISEMSKLEAEFYRRMPAAQLSADRGLQEQLLGVRSGKSQPKKLDTPRPVGYSPAPTLASKTGAAAGTPAGTSAGVQVGGPGAAPSETAAGAPAAAPAAVPAGAGVENPGASQPC